MKRPGLDSYSFAGAGAGAAFSSMAPLPMPLMITLPWIRMPHSGRSLLRARGHLRRLLPVHEQERLIDHDFVAGHLYDELIFLRLHECATVRIDVDAPPYACPR